MIGEYLYMIASLWFPALFFIIIEKGPPKLWWVIVFVSLGSLLLL
jgi:hypothetical protein